MRNYIAVKQPALALAPNPLVLRFYNRLEKYVINNEKLMNRCL